MTHFKCFGVSENSNAFGLRGVRLLDREGRFYEVGANSLHTPRRGDVVSVPMRDGELNFAACGFEIPVRKFPDAPQGIVDAVWAIETEPEVLTWRRLTS